MEKLKHTAKILDTVFKVVFWVIIVCCIGFVGLSAAMLIGGDALAQSENLRVFLSYNGISLSGDAISAVDLGKTFAAFAVLLVLTSAFSLYGISVIRKILSPMKEGSPFRSGVSQSFRRLGWLTVIFGPVQGNVKRAAQSVVLNVISEATAGTGVSFTANYALDGTFILVAALLFLFSFVFQYGEELQRLSDETL